MCLLHAGVRFNTILVLCKNIFLVKQFTETSLEEIIKRARGLPKVNLFLNLRIVNFFALYGLIRTYARRMHALLMLFCSLRRFAAGGNLVCYHMVHYFHVYVRFRILPIDNVWAAFLFGRIDVCVGGEPSSAYLSSGRVVAC